MNSKEILRYVQLKCINEPLGDSGNKIFEFSKDKIYTAELVSGKETQELDWMKYRIEDDKGNNEYFYRLDLIFDFV